MEKISLSFWIIRLFYSSIFPQAPAWADPAERGLLLAAEGPADLVPVDVEAGLHGHLVQESDGGHRAEPPDQKQGQVHPKPLRLQAGHQ